GALLALPGLDATTLSASRRLAARVATPARPLHGAVLSVSIVPGGAGQGRSGRRPAAGSRHPIFARAYALAGAAMEAGGMAARRRELLAGVAGRIIEVGAGDG